MGAIQAYRFFFLERRFWAMYGASSSRRDFGERRWHRPVEATSSCLVYGCGRSECQTVVSDNTVAYLNHMRTKYYCRGLIVCSGTEPKVPLVEQG